MELNTKEIKKILKDKKALNFGRVFGWRGLVLFLSIVCLIGAGIFYFSTHWEESLAQSQTTLSSEEQSLVILNPDSHPRAGDNWTVYFETTGTADLTITPMDQATIDDLDFVSLKCGEEVREVQILENDVIFYSGWSCDNATSSVTHLVNVAGNHALKFQFGDQIAYAFNAGEIDIGSDATNRVTQWNSGNTIIDKFNPANADGTITSIEIHLVIDATNAMIGTFYTTNGDTLKCRDSATLGAIDFGSTQTITVDSMGSPLAIEVVTGDYIGFYSSSGKIDTDTTGVGVWYKSGEYIDPDDETTYTYYDTYANSLYGIGDVAVATDVIPVGYQEWSTSTSVSYASGTDLTSSTSTVVELDLSKPTAHSPNTSTDDIYWGLGVPAGIEAGTYSGTTTFEAKAD